VKKEVGIDGDRKPPSDVCKFYLRGTCSKGRACPLRHGRPGERKMQVVCKHWLKALCKKGDHCEFLHEYNLKRMPECWFYTKYGECSNGDQCPYLHVDPEAKLVECPWYNRGFCKHGPNCRLKHVRKALCQLYVNGFCPLGPSCPNGHPKNELPDMDKLELPAPRPQSERPPGYLGSAAAAHAGHGFRKTPAEGKTEGAYRPLSEVVCFKCGQKGHYANRCSNL